MQANKARKFLGGLSAAAIMATLFIGAFSYFTDYQSHKLSATAGTLTMTMTNATEDLTDGLTILNPGDSSELTFTANNTGEKSMDVKPVITITAAKELNADDYEYKITATDGTELTGVLSSDKKTLTYSLDQVVLSGSLETETGADKTHTFNYAFEMDLDAANAWQGTEVDVNIELFAKQHRNTSSLSSDWTSSVEK